MPQNWKTYRFSELFDVSSGLSKGREEFGFGNPFVSFKDVFYNYFLPEKLGDLVNANHKEIERCSVQRGDIFLTRTSETPDDLGMSSVALKDYPKATFNGFTKRLRLKSNSPINIYPEFIAYYLRSRSFRNEVSKHSSMTTRASLNNGAINSFEVTLPTYNEQIRIAEILKPLDDKIELNLEMNKTLEAMAMALYKHWFVDFGPFRHTPNPSQEGNLKSPLKGGARRAGGVIPQKEGLRRAQGVNSLPKENKESVTSPGSPAAIHPGGNAPLYGSGKFVESELGMIPEEWEVKRLKNFGKVITGKTPSSKFPEHFGDKIPFVTPTDFKNYGMCIYDANRGISDVGAEVFGNKIIPPNSVIVTCIGSDMGKVAINKVSCLTNQQINSVVIENLEHPFVYYSMVNNYDFLKNLAGDGTTMPIINKSDFENLDILSPQKEVLNKFNNEAFKFEILIGNNIEENKTLRKIRDTLLPQLISGEIEVKTAEEEVSKVV